jgi:hypothetical protein
MVKVSMNSFTRIGLPILLVAGVVFGITFVMMYSPEEEKTPTGPGDQVQNPDRQALKFFTTKAIVSTQTSTPKHLWYWDSTIEIGAPGHFEFWCANKHDQPVTINVPATNCQCAGAEMANVPPDALNEYTVLSAISGSPLLSALPGSPFFAMPSPLAALAHVNLSQRLNWLPLYKGENRPEQTIPAASSPTNPQFAIVRLAWTGKGEQGPKGISAECWARKGDDKVGSMTVLGAETNVTNAFEPLRREGSQWATARDVSIGELRENGAVKQTIYLASFTRPYVLYALESERPTPCISWTDVVPATEEEFLSLIAHARGADNTIRRVKSLYKVEVTVRERAEVSTDGKKEVHQLDLGPIDRKLKFAGVEAGSWNLTIRGRVLGEITMLHAEDGRIDLATFSSDLGASRDITLFADRAGLDLSLLETETRPNFLQVRLEKRKDLDDGRKQWLLRVTVPKGALHGSLPESSSVVLQTKGANPRRLRIPVRGLTFDSGKPQL